jgi:hypothetical protein
LNNSNPKTTTNPIDAMGYSETQTVNQDSP